MSERASGVLLRIGLWLFVSVAVLGMLMLAARFGGWWGFTTAEALGGVTLAVGDWVPTWLQIELTLTGAAIVATLVGLFVLPPEVPPQEPGPRSSPAGAMGFFLRIVGFLVLVVAVPSTLVVTFFVADSYRVLPGTDSAGCRLVERDSGYGGDVGAVSPGSIVVEWQPYTSGCTGPPPR